jgi:RNA polymerase sigma-70 factor (ECF subfamily)
MSVAAKRITEATPEVAGNVVPFRPPSGDDTGLDDAVLLKRCAAGDGAAFRSLMARHLTSVVRTARRITASHSEAEDVAQETFLKLWNGADGVTISPAGLGPWLRRVAANQAIDVLRKAKRLDVTDEVPEQTAPADQLDHLEAADRAGRVEEALSRLPDRQRIAVGLFHFEELSHREVADAMAISEDALESLLARARRRLRDLLKDDVTELLRDY